MYDTAAFPGLRLFQHSVVKEEIGKYCHGNATISKEIFSALFNDEENWLNYSLTGILNYLKAEGNPPLQSLIEKFASDWLTKRIPEIDFSNSVVDNNEGGISLFNHIEFVKELYLKLDVDLADEIILPMLQSDFSGMHLSDNHTGVSAKIIGKIKDPVLLKNTVLSNIRSGKLASWVLITHLRICKNLHYQEVLSDFYKAITGNAIKEDHEKRALIEDYFQLGGELSDFATFLSLPPRQLMVTNWHTWLWYLMELFITTETEKVSGFLITIANDSERSMDEVIAAIKLLLQSGCMEGLNLWTSYIRQHNKLPFELQEGKSLDQFIDLSGDKDCLSLLFDTLDYSIEQKLFSSRPFDSIQECIYSLLYQLAAKNLEYYNYAVQHKNQLMEKYRNDNYAKNIEVFSERLAQKFYENHEYTIGIDTALASYEALVNNAAPQQH